MDYPGTLRVTGISPSSVGDEAGGGSNLQRDLYPDRWYAKKEGKINSQREQVKVGIVRLILQVMLLVPKH